MLDNKDTVYKIIHVVTIVKFNFVVTLSHGIYLVYYVCNLEHIPCKFHKRKDVIYAVRGTAHTLFPVDGPCLCMTYPINGRSIA